MRYRWRRRTAGGSVPAGGDGLSSVPDGAHPHGAIASTPAVLWARQSRLCSQRQRGLFPNRAAEELGAQCFIQKLD